MQLFFVCDPKVKGTEGVRDDTEGGKAVHNSLLQQTPLCCSNLKCNQTCFNTTGLEEPMIGGGGTDGRQ